MSGAKLTTKEAADKAGLTIRAIQKAIEQGRLKAEKFGRDYVIDEDDLANIERGPRGRPPLNPNIGRREYLREKKRESRARQNLKR